MRCMTTDRLLQVYWCGPLLGGIAAALLYENVFAVNASLSKAKGFLLAADYDPEDYEPNKKQPAEVTLLKKGKPLCTCIVASLGSILPFIATFKNISWHVPTMTITFTIPLGGQLFL